VLPFDPRPLTAEQRRLVTLLGRMGDEDRRTLLAFAEFLAGRAEALAPDPAPAAPERPRDIPRPEGESVVAAIRRLSETYFMLERRQMLDRTASLMAAHVIQGRPARDVVDELESVFEEHYRSYLDSWQS
jgi:hypothetical protein